MASFPYEAFQRWAEAKIGVKANVRMDRIAMGTYHLCFEISLSDGRFWVARVRLRNLVGISPLGFGDL